MTKLIDLISTSYGSLDKKFANNESDKERARASIVEAGRQDLSYKEFIELHMTILEAGGWDIKKIKEEILKVEDLKSYF